MPTPYIPKHYLLLLISVFLLWSWFQSFIASQHELNERNNQIRSATGVRSSEYWRAGYSRRQFRVPSLSNICSSTAAGRTELCPSKYWEVAITGRGSSHTQVICLSVMMREKNQIQMKHAEDSSYPTHWHVTVLFLL